MNKDSLQRFIFDKTDTRGVIVHLDEVYKEILSQHQYPAEITKLLGESLVAAVLLSATLKFEGQLTIQLQSNGPIKLLVCKCTQDLKVRGLVQFDESKLLQQKNLLDGGQLVVTIEPDNKVKPYQSIIPLSHESLVDNLEVYFGQSVQIPTKLWLAENNESAVGVLLQLLPSKNQTVEDRENFWEHAVRLGETLTKEEMLSLDNKTILHRLYHEEDIILYDEDSIEFRCTCNKARMDSVVRMLDQSEIDDIFAEKQVLDIVCEYCNSTYSYDRIDVAAVRADNI